MKILTQRLVFDVVPAGAYAESQTAPAEHVDGSGLLGHQHRLPLGQDYYPGEHLDTLGHPGEVAEEHEGLVEHVLALVGAAPVGAAGHVGPNDMVEGYEMVVAQRLGRLGVVSDHCRVGADLGLRKDDSYSHVSISLA